jgi:hypothetical protein
LSHFTSLKETFFFFLKLSIVVHKTILALRRLRQEDPECEVSLSYVGKPCLKDKKRFGVWLKW